VVFKYISVNSVKISKLRCLAIPARIFNSSKSYSSSAFLDSGSEENFIDYNFAKKCLLTFIKLESPMVVVLANGKVSTENAVLYKTAPVCVAVGDHFEHLEFLVTKLSEDVLFGFPWLFKHNPLVDWKAYKLKFSSEYCLDNCLAEDFTIQCLEMPVGHSFSKVSVLTDDWKLNPRIFAQVKQEFPEICVDLFASKDNKQLPLYFSKDNSDVSALACDAFTQDWSLYNCYANPPFSCIKKFLEKIINDKACVVTVLPFWEWADWFPLAEKLAIGRRFDIEHSVDTYLPIRNGFAVGVGLPTWKKSVVWELDARCSTYSHSSQLLPLICSSFIQKVEAEHVNNIKEYNCFTPYEYAEILNEVCDSNYIIATEYQHSPVAMNNCISSLNEVEDSVSTLNEENSAQFIDPMVLSIVQPDRVDDPIISRKRNAVDLYLCDVPSKRESVLSPITPSSKVLKEESSLVPYPSMEMLDYHDQILLPVDSVVPSVKRTIDFIDEDEVVCKRVSSICIDSMLEGFDDLFDEVLAETLPENRKYDCEIDLIPGSKLPFGPIYKTTVDEAQLTKEFLDENLRKGFIRHSLSKLSSPCFFVPKKDGSKRLVIDFKLVNAITVKVRYPLPLIDSILQQLSKASVFTSLDLRGAYNLVRVKPGDEWKTAFRTQFGLFESLVMPFGLVNAPAVFQKMMNEILGPFIGVFVLVYFDDILIFSENIEEHTQHVRTVLSKLKEYKLYCKKSKCHFAVDSLVYLGYVVSKKGISMDMSKIKALKEFSPPKSVKEIQQFLGFANYYRNFIPGYADITKPLSILTKKGEKFVMTDEAVQAFHLLIEAFCSASILRHADVEKQFILETDASDVAVGAVLSQLSDDNEIRPVAYFSKQLKPAECNYDIYDRELLAVFLAMKNWRHLLMGARYTTLVYTDHKNLEYFSTTKQYSPRQARWGLFFTMFDFKIIYVVGKDNVKADFLSRYGLPDAVKGTREPILPSIRFGCISIDD